ncbi:hypothetical protein J0X14_04565 [Muricauda sp. CAU 1633]|uniref:hypothetical protein n=1 Tax=Allomuricauda sp. CAU 1633 TaxID=2816036 RepID=UPI001A8F9CC5|nr:hypothetical protein [Muricauda sp. CAU 1633]MBO0321562.1 hypothetical protein [Muricauda sp. CAU 1633]
MDPFGLLKGHDLTNMDPMDRQRLLLSHGLMEPIHVIALTAEPKQVFPPTGPPVMRYTQHPTIALHSFLLDRYIDLIDGPFLGFFHDFNEEIFGLGKKKSKKLALQYYTLLADSMITKSIRFIRVQKDKSGIESVSNIGKLEMLDGQRNTLKDNLANSELLDHYLMGDEGHFSIDLVGNDKTLGHFIDFETALKILLSLNHSYGFEANPFSVPQEKTFEEPNQVKKTIPKIKKTSVLSDEEALDYLLKNVFGSKGDTKPK